MKDLVLVGLITGAHGIRGEVRLRSFTAEPDMIASYSPLESSRGRVEIVKLRTANDGFIAVLKGVADRNAAEALKGTELFVPRTRLAEPKEGEIYVHDLIGLPVLLKDESRLGEIVGVENFGAGDLLDVRIEGRRDTALIPLAGGFVAEAGKERVVVDLPEGFLDEDAGP